MKREKNMSAKEWVLEQINQMDFHETFIIDAETDKQYSYCEFFSSVFGMDAYLNRFHAGTIRIIPVLENGIGLLTLYFCCMLTDRVIIPIDPQKGTSEIDKILSENRQDGLIIGTEQIEECTSTNTFVLSDSDVVKDMVIQAFESRRFDTDYLISFTSGTSGNSKGVRHSLNDMFLTIQAFDVVHPFKKNRFFGHLLPMTYMAGILNSIIQPFVSQNKIVVLGRFNIKMAIKCWKVLEKYNVTQLWMTPTMINMVYNTDRGGSGVKYCKEHDMQIFVGTSPLSMQLKEQFEERYQTNLYISYGLTETLFVSVDTEKSHGRKDGNVGEILPGVDFAKLTGEALIDVKWMFTSYTNEDTSGYFDGRFYKTGDLIEIQDDILYIVGRKKDLIIKGGLNISPVAIEHEILKLSIIKDVAVFGEKDKEEEKIVCVYSINANMDYQDLQKHINRELQKNLGKPYTADVFYPVSDLLYNINGKKDIEKIKEKVREKGCW